MAINVSTSPYFDDFDPNKNFHRILFKPGKAVQARELTQSQTILQDQISKFASSIFSQNTPVSGGKITTNFTCSYIKLNSTYQGVSIVASDFENRLITDSTGTILAKVIATTEATDVDTTAGDPPTLIVSYLSGIKFSDNMDIFPTDGSNFVATTIGSTGGSTCSGPSSVASISPGVFYVVHGYNLSTVPNGDGSYSKYSIGNFVNVLQQTIILNKYGNTPSYRVGLQITETINDYIDDPSLLDPAIGSSNYQAPGADRYIIRLTLTSLPLSLGNDDGFIELLRINNGSVLKQVDSTVYSTIDDYFAKRTFDTNGDYIVNPFKLTPATNSDPLKYNIGISKGIAYVRGYRLENQSTIDLIGNRARTYNSLQNNNISIDYGNFLYVDNLLGSSTNFFEYALMQSVDFHSVPRANVVSTNVNTYNSTLVATGRIRNLDFDYFTDTAANTASYVYKAAVCDIQTKTLTSNASSATTNTITFYDTTSKFSTKNDAYVGVTLSIDSGTSLGDRRVITAYNGSTKTATVDQAFSTTPTVSSNFTLRFDISDIELMAAANATYGLVSSANISNVGKTGSIATGDTVLQDAGYPELLFRVGNPYVKTITDVSFDAKNYFRNQTFATVSGGVQCQIQFDTLDINVLNFQGRTGTPLSASEVLQYYTIVVKNKGSNSGLTNGQILNFTSAGRTITVSNDKNTLTLFASDLSAATTFTVDVIAKVSVSDTLDNGHILRSKSLITTNTSVASNTNGTVVNTNTYVDLTNAQVYITNAGLVTSGLNQSLYISDVKRIVKIIDTGAPGTLPTVGMISSSQYDVTPYFDFSTGQTDNYYDHASIKLRAGAPKIKGNLLVLLDYYSHSGGDAYFDIHSYVNSASPEDYAELPSYVATNGTIYSLRDCLDFRPSRINAISAFTFRVTSPESVEAGIYIPDNLSTFISDYSYYLPRKDLIVLSKDRNFQLIEGVADDNPTYPAQPDGSLLIAKLNLDAYTAYIPGEAPLGLLPNLSVEPTQHKRWTMQDISDLQTRVNNLEYYTALSMLEQKASSTQVPDVNGLNRFKNGILVDDFSSFSTADTANREFSASINKRTRQLTAAQTVDNFALQNPSVLNSLGNLSSTTGFKVSTVNKTTNIFTLPYTTANVITQQLASNTVNLNPFATNDSEGVLELHPPMDNWVDNTKAPDLLIVDPSLQILQQSDTVNVLSVGDWKTVPGTTAQSQSTSLNTFFNGRLNTQETTTTRTYATLGQTNTLGYYQQINNTYDINNNYITDVSILPYIRSQEVLIKASRLLVNTPITVTFDGVNVNQYIKNCDTIELTNVSGTFNTGDIIGYTDNNVFYRVATVSGVYKYPNLPNKVRLYVAGIFNSVYHNSQNLSNPVLQSALYDENGAIVSHPASGTTSSSKLIDVHVSGQVPAVGGTFTDVLGSSVRFYRIAYTAFGNFVNKYAIWGDSRGYGSVLAKCNTAFTVTSGGTHYMRYATSSVATGYIKINGNYVVGSNSSISATYASDVTITLNTGKNYIEFFETPSNINAWGYLAFAISTQPWSGNYNYSRTNGTIVYDSSSLNGDTTPLNAGTEVQLPGGGLYYVGATQISLSNLAKSTDNYYNGCTINVTTTYVSRDVLTGATSTRKETFSSVISSYTALGSTAVLATPINVSIGQNDLTKTDITSTYSITGTHANYALGIQSGGISKLSTDENGNFVAIFDIPAATFKTGDRILQIDNRTTPLDPDSATSVAYATFTASGLSTKSQALSFGVSVAGAKNTFTQTTYRPNQLISTTTTQRIIAVWDPVAQSFLVQKDNYPNGVFLDSIDVFFQSKPTTTNDPVTLSIVPTINGYPGGETLDNSIVTLTADKIKTSSTPHYLDPATKTTFKFSAPVYIQPGVLHAFILRSPSDQYNIYHASQNAIALPSSVKANYTDPTPTTLTKIGGVPGIGGMFESQNGMTWTAEQSKTLMMVINRCVFNTSVNPTIPFVIPTGLPYRKSSSGDIRYLQDPTNVSAISNQIAGVDVEAHAFNITTTDFTPTNTGIVYSYNATLKNGNIETGLTAVTPGKFACPTPEDIYLSDGRGERILLANSSNSFLVNVTLSSSDNTVSPMVADDGLTLFNTQWNINNLELSNNQIRLISGGTGYNTGTPNANVVISSPDVAGGSQALASANVVNGIIQSIYLTNSGSGYLSAPTITITGANTTPASASMVSEFSPVGGNATCKYFTKKVVMAAGNDSQDLRVFYTAYKPSGTNIYVFYKVLNSNDTTKFDDNGWQLMTTIGQNKNIYSATRNDVYEFEAAPGTVGLADNYLTYTNVNGQTYDSFIQFAIKVVMTTNDKTAVPIISELRALALPSGTGI
jgi:hypothetical protein